MLSTDAQLPNSVTRVTIGKKQIFLIGTAHVSKQSVEDVRATIASLKPDSVCVELCSARYKALVQQKAWRSMNIYKVIKEKRALFLLAQLVLNSFYRKIGAQLGVQPGAEMIEGIYQAESIGAELVLADRNVEITLKRVWGFLNFWNKLKMITHILAGLFLSEKIDEQLVEEIKKRDQLENVLETFARAFPEVKKRLIDERDMYLAHKIATAPGDIIVAVVGAGHVPGIQRYFSKEVQLEAILEIPPKSFVPVFFKWGIPLIIIFLVILGFFKDGAQHGIESIYIWIAVNGCLAAVGAALAFAHPLTILASFIGAPLTSLNPLIAAGWVAGLVQAWVKKPTVADFEDLPQAISTVKGFWMNPVCRILLVVALANLGSSLGTFISGSWIAARTL